MSKEQLYNKIKIFVYRKFDELEVVESDHGKNIYLHYKNNGYAEIRIQKNSGVVVVYYNYEFKNKFFKIIRLEKTDFEIILSRWVEDTFQMKVIDTDTVELFTDVSLKIPFK